VRVPKGPRFGLRPNKAGDTPAPPKTKPSQLRDPPPTAGSASSLSLKLTQNQAENPLERTDSRGWNIDTPKSLKTEV
jgi:hypothetical protein